MKKTILLFYLLIITTLVYLPLFSNPSLFLQRGNDLQEFFWPLYNYTKSSILLHKELPLWNTLFLSGIPLVADPQAPLFYLPNLIFLFLPLDIGFILSFFVHTLLGGIGMYLLAKRALKISPQASLFAASLYITTPRFAAYLEAGHVGLVYSMAWIPWIFFSLFLMYEKRKLGHGILFAIFLSLTFYTHVLTFFILIISTALLSLYFIVFREGINALGLYVFATLICFGLIAIALLPQLEWSEQTTRFLLLKDRDVYPKWNGKFEYIRAVLFPWITGINGLQKLDTEKWIVLGILPSVLAIRGWLKTNKGLKTILVLGFAGLILFTLNNTSPIYQLLIKQNWYVLLRVATRVWVLLIPLVCILAAIGYQNLSRLRNLFAIIAVSECILLGWGYLAKQVVVTSRAPQAVFDFLKSDSDHFRVFCTTRCLSQNTSSQEGLELIDGYATLQEKKYYYLAQDMTRQYWDYYTLSIPPFGTYLFNKINPDTQILGLLNDKYVISPYAISNQKLVLTKKFQGYFVYLNIDYKPRIFTSDKNSQPEITFYSRNKILASVSSQNTLVLYFSQILNSGWKAKVDENEVAISETPIHLQQISVPPGVHKITIYYLPNSLILGTIITAITLLFLLTLSFNRLYLKR